LILVWFVSGCVYFDLFRFYLLSIIFNFVCSWDTRWWIKSKNTICLILIHHRQNPTKIMNLWSEWSSRVALKVSANVMKTEGTPCSWYFECPSCYVFCLNDQKSSHLSVCYLHCCCEIFFLLGSLLCYSGMIWVHILIVIILLRMKYWRTVLHNTKGDWSKSFFI